MIVTWSFRRLKRAKFTAAITPLNPPPMMAILSGCELVMALLQ
jgi:hypothetical protein